MPAPLRATPGKRREVRPSDPLRALPRRPKRARASEPAAVRALRVSSPRNTGRSHREPRRLRRPGTRPILGFRRARARLDRARARGPYAGWTSLDSRSERSASDTPRGPASRVCTRPIDAFNTPHANSGRRVKPPSIFPSLLHISRQGTGTTTTSEGSHERLPANQPLVAGVIRTFQPPRPPTRRRDDPRGDESGTSRGYFPRDVRGRRAAVDDGARHDGIRVRRVRTPSPTATSGTAHRSSYTGSPALRRATPVICSWVSDRALMAPPSTRRRASSHRRHLPRRHLPRHLLRRRRRLPRRCSGYTSSPMTSTPRRTPT